ncbi:MAG: hypothetical protein HIU82_17450 [Proteobacteria bacterium]|nr:hypothetical protein [Pseudomonadota bacterium]
MSDWREVMDAVAQWAAPHEAGEFLVVPTYATYPSNSLVQAYVAGSKGTFIVSDGGGAIRVLLGAGGLGSGGKRLLSDFARGTDVKVNESGWLYIAGVTLGALTSAISAIAGASKDAAIVLLRKFNPTPAIDFRRDLALALDIRFRDAVQKHGHLPGASNKLHTFDYLVRANDNTLLALDAVVNDASSINAAVVAHMDVRATKRSDLKQFIIYDEDEDWSASDLALLTVGAPTVSFPHFAATLDRALVRKNETG